MPNKQSTLNQMNKRISKLIPQYCDEIPLDALFEIAKDFGAVVVDESGDEWSGFLCGESGNTVMKVLFPESGYKNVGLSLSWYKMQSGRFEIVAYFS